ncbi:hypothetical protein [Gemmobacter caeruleus]|uniref:hypothetical protein n=1 Tax=Gemmobacter caeruleus TaxID=2595004 RepID=UPI0011EF2D4F|nr:hypothetical protein [Gemmobacter caeruleus]
MLAVWPLVMLLLFRRLPADRALIWSVLGGYMVLPPAIAFNLPVVPDITKDSLPGLVALAIVLFVLKDRLSFWPESWLGRGLIVLFVLSPFGTVLTNPEPVPIGPGMLQGMRLYDSVAAVTNQMIEILPLFLARRYLGTPEGMRAILVALVAAGLAYSLPMMIEARLSPQLNVWIYGYFQHDFFQTIRNGGFRPVVFMPHGLWVAFFALMAFAAALVFLRLGPVAARPRQFATVLYLGVMLALCKSMGVLIDAAVLLPLILFAPRRWQVYVAFVLALVVITYPALRGLHLLPLDEVTNFARGFSADRAGSFQFRLNNEEALLVHAAEKPWFGWGGYGRNLLYDPLTGARLSIADGAWIITLGLYGWAGYVAQFGLLVLPLLLLGREVWRGAGPASPWVAGVALIFAANLIDLLPNGTLVPFTWLLAGAILGQAELLSRQRALRRQRDIATHWQAGQGRTVI